MLTRCKNRLKNMIYGNTQGGSKSITYPGLGYVSICICNSFYKRSLCVRKSVITCTVCKRICLQSAPTVLFQNPLHQFPRSKSVTSWRLPRSKSTTSPQHKRQVRNKWVRAKSVMSVVSCRFPSSITTTCCGLLAVSLTSPHQVGSFPVYGEVMGERA